jgi:hypothetical protein
LVKKINRAQVHSEHKRKKKGVIVNPINNLRGKRYFFEEAI